MQRVRRVDASPRGIQQAFADHRLGAAWPFLTGLEHQHNVSGELIAHCVKDASGADQGRHMEIMAARVHHTIVLRRVVDVDVLRDRQRVHVTAQQHDLSLAGLRFGLATQNGHDRRQ